MDQQLKNSLRARLEDTRQQLQSEITDLRDVAVKATTYLEDEKEAYDDDVAGDANSLVGRQTDMTLLLNLEREISDTEAALERMAGGTYGLCQVCHKQIPDKRLQARPAAITCIDCQSALEARHRRERQVNGAF